MATNFYDRQEAARRNTLWLVLLFIAAVVFIVGAVAAVAYLVTAHQTSSGDRAFGAGRQGEISPLASAAVAGAVTLAAIVLGTLFKIVQLRHGGGSFLAERLDGARLYPNSGDVTGMRVLNVVEEMAIASGTPVPPVFLLRDDETINAFAAGYSPSDAVIGITRGCAESLTREQLQGVIAHEFSHILNGDMRMNIRLIGILHGILLLALTGRLILRSVMHRPHHRSSNRKSDPRGILLLLAVAVALLILGWIGYVIGGLIKAAVSRQREYLADASAVQFTRNPDGIAGALKRIAAVGSRLQSPHASEASHMFFAQGLAEGLTSLTATHPPIRKRILALEPSWDGTLPREKEVAPPPQPKASESTPSSLAAAVDTVGFAPPVRSDRASGGEQDAWDRAELRWATEHVGDPLQQHREYAEALLQSIDPDLLAAARDPFSSRALVLALLLPEDAELRSQQWQWLSSHADAALIQEMQRLADPASRAEPRTRLPLIDLSLPALRSLSPAQYRDFKSCFERLILADDRLSLFEWTLGKLLLRHLAPQFESVGSPGTHYYGLQRLSRPCSVLLSTIARVGHTPAEADRAFELAARSLPQVRCEWLPPSACTLDELERSLKTLARTVAPLRGRLVEACAQCISADGYVTVREGELLRGIADMLDCPMPPLLPGQPLVGAPTTPTHESRLR